MTEYPGVNLKEVAQHVTLALRMMTDKAPACGDWAFKEEKND